MKEKTGNPGQGFGPFEHEAQVQIPPGAFDNFRAVTGSQKLFMAPE